MKKYWYTEITMSMERRQYLCYTSIWNTTVTTIIWNTTSPTAIRKDMGYRSKESTMPQKTVFHWCWSPIVESKQSKKSNMPIPNRWISSFVTTILREIRCRKPLRCSIPNVRIVPTLTNGWADAGSVSSWYKHIVWSTIFRCRSFTSFWICYASA